MFVLMEKNILKLSLLLLLISTGTLINSKIQYEIWSNPTALRTTKTLWSLAVVSAEGLKHSSASSY